MKPIRGRVEKFLDWVQDYGWSIPVFSLGLLAGASLGGDWLEVATAFGTLAAAFAAFWTVNFARKVQRQRDAYEDELRRPNLQISYVELVPDEEQSQYIFHFANLSQQSIYVNEIVTFDPQPPVPIVEDWDPPMVLDYFRLVIPEGGTASRKVNLYMLSGMGSFDLWIYFTYALTGPIVHRLRLPVEIGKWSEQGELKSIMFELGNQPIEEDVEPPFGNPGIGLAKYGP